MNRDIDNSSDNGSDNGSDNDNGNGSDDDNNGNGNDDRAPGEPAAGFVRRLLSPPAPLGGHRELGTTALAQQLGLAEDQLGGHWCSRCQGIWYGCALEVQCPVCGNRNG